MEIECQCGEHFLVLLSNFKKGKIYCNNCLDKIRKQKQFNKIANYIYNCGNVIISDYEDYVDCDSLLKIKCNCGEIFRTTFKRYKHKGKRQCDSCGFIQQLKSQKRNVEVVYSLFKNKGLIPMFSDEDYKNSNSSLGFKCSKHIEEEIQYTTYNSLVRDFAIGCKHCRDEKLREEFKIKNPRDFFIEKRFIPLFENDQYINSSQRLPFICRIHEEYGVQETNLNNVRYNKGCKYCSDSKSKGEIRIQEVLDQFDSINYKPQESLPDCKYKIPLKFDFLVFTNNKLNLVIEYDGQQHFEPVDFAGKGEEWALKQFKETKKRDAIKNRFCKDKNIHLLRIPYWEFDNIETIIQNHLIHLVI
jgi:hypothetical protein